MAAAGRCEVLPKADINRIIKTLQLDPVVGLIATPR